MKKSDIDKTVKRLNENMLHLLRSALCTGEEYRQQNGKTRISAKQCKINGYEFRHLHAAKTSLHQRGLLEGSYFANLTTDGFQVARAHMAAWLVENDGSIIQPSTNGTFTDDDGNPAYVATTVEDYVSHYLKLREDVKAERLADLKKAQRLWRGIRLPHWTGRRMSMSAVLADEFPEGDGESMRVSLEDFIALGEEIERLRA